METNGIPFEVMEALAIQPAGESVRIAGLEIIEELKRIHIRKILIGGCDQLTAGTSRDRRFNIRSKQTKARLLDEADRKAKRTASINILLQFVNEFNFSVVGVKLGFHRLTFPYVCKKVCPDERVLKLFLLLSALIFTPNDNSSGIQGFYTVDHFDLKSWR